MRVPTWGQRGPDCVETVGPANGARLCKLGPHHEEYISISFSNQSINSMKDVCVKRFTQTRWNLI